MPQGSDKDRPDQEGTGEVILIHTKMNERTTMLYKYTTVTGYPLDCEFCDISTLFVRNWEAREGAVNRRTG